MNTSVPNEAPSGCPVCGADLPPNAPRGLCPKCLLDGAAAPTEPATSPQGRPEPPPIEAVRAAFPQLEVLELIGAGGMGAVYRARQPKLDRLVALKLLAQPSGQNPAFIERFHREARVLARLNHPNIVAVFDFGEASGFSYLLMEYVDGVNLRQAMHTRRFTPEQALAIVPRLCEALQFAHEQGILHRDIKPENILLDSLGRVKIADFGIAKLVGGDKADVTLTASGAALGTPAYMAPEQLRRAGKVDHRADIYSLGVLFYEMLTGDLPVGRFDPPSQRVQVDVRLDHVVLRALENQPDRRYQHASEIKSEVEGITRAPSLPGPAAGGSSATATAPAAGWASTPAQDSRGDLDAVKEAVRGPAIGLMVAGGLDVASSLLPMLAAWLGTLGGAFRGSAGLPAFGIWELGIVSGMGSVSMVAAVFTVLGGQAMMRLKSSG
ncbi:MAG: serine/threonine protein kinase, partial [Verrucomicrobiales bacterium]|nr:serine/threonine protein kinase [Verrucomicrobiales bacterium]